MAKNLHVDDEIHRNAKIMASSQGITLKDYIKSLVERDAMNKRLIAEKRR